MSSEHHEELEKRLREAAAQEHLWKTFMEHPGWSAFEKVLQEQQRLREVLVRQSYVHSVGEAFGQEGIKGEANGIGIALQIPSQLLEAAQLERRLATKELEIEDATESEVAAAGRNDRLSGSPFGGFGDASDDSGDGS